MNLTAEQQRDIAQSVLRAYHIHPSVCQQFRKGTKNHRLYYSERISANLPAVLYYLDNNPEWEAKVRDFEKKTGRMAFHTILTHTDFGDVLDILYVPSEAEELDAFIKDAKKGLFRSYCWNMTDDFCESGYIGVRPRMGGIERIQ